MNQLILQPSWYPYHEVPESCQGIPVAFVQGSAFALAGGLATSYSYATETDPTQNAAISLTINKTIQLQDAQNPGRSAGTLTAGSRVTLAIPAAVATKLNGKTALSNEELSGLLGQIGSIRRGSSYQHVALNVSEQYSTVPNTTSAGSLNLKSLLKSDALSLGPVQYNVASIATGPGQLEMRDSASRPEPGSSRPAPVTERTTSAPAARSAATTPAVTAPTATREAARPRAATQRTQADVPCATCALEQAEARTRPGTQNLAQLRSVGESTTRVQPPARQEPAPTRTARAADTRRETARPAPVAPAATGSGSDYSNSAAVQKMIAYAMSHKHARSTGKCYRYVKQALYAAGLLPYNALNGLIPAGHAGVDLARLGWKDLTRSNPSLLTNPRAAPVGSIVVYRDNQGGFGHVEIRTSTGFVSDYFSAAGPYGRRFKVAAVMVPPNY